MKFEKNYSIAYFKKRKTIWYVLETVIITLAGLFLSLYVDPTDPFSLNGPVSWLTIIPIFCSLLYGSMNGIISLSLLLVYLMFHKYMYNVDEAIIREYSVAISCFTLICGAFSSYWLARINHVEHLNRYVREHLEDLSRDYYQLKISHERIEHAYIIKPLSFRDAFLRIRAEMLLNNGEINQETSQHLLNIFSQYCSINSAVVGTYSAADQEFKILAQLGKPFSVDLNDALIKQALKKRSSTYIAVNALALQQKSDYIAVLPLLTSTRKVQGLIIIKDIPFWSLTHDNLEVLSVFAATFSLQWNLIEKVSRLLEIFPTCPPEFMRELQTLKTLKKYHSVDSALVGILLPDNRLQENIIFGMENNKRSLDFTWILSLYQAKLYIVLLPLTSQPGVLGYKKRLARWFKSEFGQELNDEQYRFYYQLVNKNAVNEQLSDFIQECSNATA